MKPWTERIALLLALCLMAGALCGCFAPSEEEEEPSKVAVMQETAQGACEAFVEALATGDYSTAFALTEACTEDSFVSAEDIQWYLPRSSYAAVQNLGFETFKTESSGSEVEELATYTVTLYDAADESGSPKKKSFPVEATLNYRNQWVVCAPEFYCTNFLFRTAGGDTKVYIDGNLVSDLFCKDDRAGAWELCKDYVIPFIGKKDVNVRIVSDNFDHTQRVTPNSDNKISDSVSVFMPVSEPDKCLAYVKDTWNELCAKYLIGETASCVQDYIAADASYDICNTVWEGFDSIHKGDSSQGGFKCEKFKLTTCRPSTKGNICWISDSEILCYFDYELTWFYTFGKENQLTHQNSSIILNVNKGVYQIYELTDTGLFFDANHYSSEW